MIERAVELLLDSGAYSVWTRGKTINIRSYIGFIRDHAELIGHYANLDVVPGSPNRKCTASELAKAAKESYRNLQIMKDAGLRPIPVFHQGENFTWLEKLIDDGEEYIGLGGLLGVTIRQRIDWLDQCFTLLTDAKGRPLLKVHGFGTTSFAILKRYPWHSVDSTVWVKPGGYGFICVPKLGADGRPNYRKNPVRVHISRMATKQGKTPIVIFDVLGKYEKIAVRRFLAEHGFTLGEIIYNRHRRCLAVLAYLRGLQDFLQKEPSVFRYRKSGILDHRSLSDGKSIASWARAKPQFQVYHATNLSNDQSAMLTEAKARYRLLSYSDIRNGSSTRFETYIRNGVDPTFRGRQPKQNWKDPAYLGYRYLALQNHWKGYHDVAEE